MKRKFFASFLSLCMVLSLVPMTALAAEGDVAQVGDTTYPTLQAAFNAANQATNKEVKLISSITVSDPGPSAGYGSAAIVVPEGITLDGNGYTIKAETWTSENQYHVVGVMKTKANTTTTIENLTIVGNANTKSGIHAYNCEGTVNLTGVTIKNCGNAAVQVNGSTVIATGLTTSGNTWGGVNVDRGTNVTTTASFTLDATSSIAEPVKVWTELTGQENIIAVPNTWKQVKGSSNNAYAPTDTLTQNVVYNAAKGTYYQSLELAVKEADEDNVLNVYPGNYNIQQDDTTTVQNQTGWYLPINNSITIQGVDATGEAITDATKTQANIYSTDYSDNGAWATQNLITVLADNVTISGLTIMNKVAANKAIEVTSDANDFSITSCKFAPISEELLEGIEASTIGGYTYAEYKEYGASLYFNGDVKDATVEGNYFDHSGITFDSTKSASVSVTNNVFAGEKNWNNSPDYTYSSIGYTSWASPAVTDISNANLEISQNQFIEAGKINFSKVEKGQVNVSANYWEGMDLTESIVGGDNNAVKMDTIYTDKDMSEVIEVAPLSKTLQSKIDAAGPGAVIDLEGKYWPGNLEITKNITLKNGSVDTVAAIGDLENLAFQNITFRSASNVVSLDSNPSALYLQGTNTISNVLVENCIFQGPDSEDTTVAITTVGVNGLTVKNSTIDGYTISAYHNPGTEDVTYQENTFKNILSGIGFIGTDGITVTGNTFENANGLRLEPDWSNNDNKCTGIDISGNKFVSVSGEDTHGQYAVRAQNSAGKSGIAEDTTLDLGYNYWGSANPDFDALIVAPNDQEIVVEPYYEASTMRPQDLNTYRPPVIANPNYKITIGAMENGTVTANPTAAKAGATVTLTATPDEGYALSTLTVTDRFGDAGRVTENSAGTYPFPMPNGQVTVTATFVETEEPVAEPFVDVAEGDWFYDAVVYAYQNELMDGVGGNRFAPNSETTRAQLVTILYRLEGEPAVSGDLPFTDVETGIWYTDAILWAAQNNIVNGVSDTEFAPGDDLTRQQLVTILYRYAEAKGYDVSASADLSGYPDAGQVQAYAQPAMAWAVAENIIQGMEDGTLKPAGNASRAQIATILMRFCEDVAQ